MKSYKIRLLKLAVPIILSNLISQAQMLIDRIFLGRINVLYMSAVGNASAPMWTTMAFIFSLSVGASILISQAVGENNKEKIEKYAASLLKFGNIIPILLFFFWTFCSPFVYKLMGVSENVLDLCVSYTRFMSPSFLILGIGASFMVILQTSNYTKHLVTYGIIRSSLNVILDYCLIFGNFGFPEMGIKGAALATTIAEYCGLLFGLIIFVKSRKLTTRPKFSSVIKAKFTPFLESAKLGFNTALEDFLWNFGNLGIVRILNSISDVAAGIYTILFGVELIIVSVIASIGNGTMTLCGEATGAKNGILLRRIVKTAYFWTACLSFATVLVTFFFPKQLLGLFTKDLEIIAASTTLLLLVGINLFGKSANIIMGNGIRGYGDTKWMFFSQIFGTIFVLSIASLFVYVFKFGIMGVYLAIISDEIVRGIINTIRFSKIKLYKKPYKVIRN